MVKIQIKYENEEDKLRIIKILSRGSKIIDIRPKAPKKTGKFTRVYLEVEWFSVKGLFLMTRAPYYVDTRLFYQVTTREVK